MNRFHRAVLGAALLGGLMCMAMADASAQAESACNPSVPAVSIPGNGTSTGAEKVLRRLYEEDQRDRAELERSGIAVWPKVESHDIDHRRKVLGMLERTQISSAQELYLAAFIFQHGACSDDYALSNKLAEAAISRGSKDAKWLYAASMDRYLVSKHLPQKFGTQFRIENGEQRLLPLDDTTTDEDRKKYNVPPLAELLKGDE